MRTGALHLLGYLSLPLSLMTLHACLTSTSLDHDLATTYSTEFYLSPTEANGLFIANQFFPCLDIGSCSPEFITPTTVSLSTPRTSMVIAPQGDFTYRATLDRPIDAGDTIQLSISIEEVGSWDITEVMPTDLALILEHDYRVDTPNNGLFLRLDTTALKRSNGFYLLVFTESFVSPRFGILIPPDREQSAFIPSNGGFIEEDPSIYFVPQSTLEQTGITINSGERYITSVRHLTPGSYDFYLAYKNYLDDNTDGLSPGLLFAPPDQLPSNLEYPGFGYVHVYQERIIVGPID